MIHGAVPSSCSPTAALDTAWVVGVLAAQHRSGGRMRAGCKNMDIMNGSMRREWMCRRWRFSMDTRTPKRCSLLSVYGHLLPGGITSCCCSCSSSSPWVYVSVCANHRLNDCFESLSSRRVAPHRLCGRYDKLSVCDIMLGTQPTGQGFFLLLYLLECALRFWSFPDCSTELLCSTVKCYEGSLTRFIRHSRAYDISRWMGG